MAAIQCSTLYMVYPHISFMCGMTGMLLYIITKTSRNSVDQFIQKNIQNYEYKSYS